MRSVFLLVLLPTFWACSPSREEPCSAAYEHLLKISEQERDSNVRERFISACLDAWDQERHQCIMEATTSKAAMACDPGRVPPS
jgi:hypothetical protein